MKRRPQPWLDLVLAVDAMWGIGCGDALPWPRLSTDLRHFKTLTSNAQPGLQNAVIMGRRTWESAEVARRALPRRVNVVLTRRPFEGPPGVQVSTSLDDALDQLAERSDIDQVFVIGGAEIYRLALVHPRCRDIYLTRVIGDFHCDVVVPNLDELCEADPSWQAVTHHEQGIEFRIEKLRLKQPPQT
jgi:dihydrofolate reductase